MILENKAKCPVCGDIVESKTRHDFVTCSCGNLSVDGGKDYLKRCFGDAGYEEMSIEMNRLKAMLQERSINAKGFAEKNNIPVPSFYKMLGQGYDLAKIRVGTFKKVADGFDMSLGELYMELFG